MQFIKQPVDIHVTANCMFDEATDDYSQLRRYCSLMSNNIRYIIFGPCNSGETNVYDQFIEKLEQSTIRTQNHNSSQSINIWRTYCHSQRIWVTFPFRIMQK